LKKQTFPRFQVTIAADKLINLTNMWKEILDFLGYVLAGAPNFKLDKIPFTFLVEIDHTLDKPNCKIEVHLSVPTLFVFCNGTLRAAIKDTAIYHLIKELTINPCQLRLIQRLIKSPT